jgi:TIGR03009 family protein
MRAGLAGSANDVRATIIFMEGGFPMRWSIRKVVGLAAVVGVTSAPIALAQAQNRDNRVKPAQAGSDPAAARIAPADAERMERLLRLWERESAQLKSLDVTIERLDKNPAWGEDEHYTGRALLMSPDLAWLDFQKVTMKDGKPVLDPQGKPDAKPYERIICTGQEVWQYLSSSKQIFIYPLERQSQKRALEEGPLPFLFNFREAEARQRYELSPVSKPEEENECYWIGIKPRLVMDRDAFSLAFVRLDKRLMLPDRIYLIAPDGKSKRDYRLTNIKRNQPVMVANFRGQRIPGWKVIDNREGPVEAGPAKGQGGATPLRPTGSRPRAPEAVGAEPARSPGR